MIPRLRFAVACVAVVTLLGGCGGGQSEVQQTSGTTTGPVASCKPAFAADTPNGISQERLPVGEVTIRGSGEPVILTAEVADDAGEMEQGLMFRRSLGEDCGMLFMYPVEQELSFWMRNTLIPLSIAYADSEGRIVDIQEMKALDDEPPNYTSARPAQFALEVNPGFFKENGVEVGDTIRITVPQS